MTSAEAFRLILAERARQQRMWGGEHSWGAGDCSSDGVAVTVKVAVLAEEVGEVARVVLDGPAKSSALREELVQVAAVALAWLEGLPA